MSKVFKLVGGLVAIAVLLMAVAGCSNGTPTTATSPSVSPTSPPPSTTPTTSVSTTTPLVGTTTPTSKPPTSPATTTPGGGTGLIAITVTPASFLDVPNRASQSLKVIAAYGDGRTADVTAKCTYVSTDDLVAMVITKEMPGEDADHPPVPGYWLFCGNEGGAIVTITYTEGGVTKTCELPVSVYTMMLQ